MAWTTWHFGHTACLLHLRTYTRVYMEFILRFGACGDHVCETWAMMHRPRCLPLMSVSPSLHLPSTSYHSSCPTSTPSFLPSIYDARICRPCINNPDPDIHPHRSSKLPRHPPHHFQPYRANTPNIAHKHVALTLPRRASRPLPR
jgi:hypothetical protein